MLEIGAGSGRNLPFYGPSAKQILALEPSPRLLELAGGMRHQEIPITFLEASAEAIPLDDRTVDTVVTTWSLCTIPHAATALNEMDRVLRPGGRLRFVEHGLAPDVSVRWWQDRLTPAWKTISGGCHLNRPIQALIEGAGFRVERIQIGYMPGSKPMTFMYEGSAAPG